MRRTIFDNKGKKENGFFTKFVFNAALFFRKLFQYYLLIEQQGSFQMKIKIILVYVLSGRLFTMFSSVV